ncbi:MAG: hypothetical protein II438_05640 [Clostridiales bacterium]|nr:hypothetical protein [Clostridiales bacterium]
MEVQTGKIISAQKAPTHFMLASKIVILVATLILYVMQMLIAVPLFGAFVLEANWGELDNTRLSAVGILLAVALVLDLVSFVLAIIGSAKQEDPKTKMTVIIKALFIPFFLINITLYVLSFLGMLNPFLMWAIPLVMVIGVCLTYAYMFMSSWPDIIYMIIYTIKNKRRPKPGMVLGIIFEFFFVLDIVGAILVNKAYKESLKENV